MNVVKNILWLFYILKQICVNANKKRPKTELITTYNSFERLC